MKNWILKLLGGIARESAERELDRQKAFYELKILERAREIDLKVFPARKEEKEALEEVAKILRVIRFFPQWNTKRFTKIIIKKIDL